ncbi:hypothetical protein H4R19_003393 [Coemansia spiralis]|nr:hypothetical protein H4R19_003393 [Coemansia spiralis]
MYSHWRSDVGGDEGTAAMVGEFEKEFQLKQHLAKLLRDASLPSAQHELNVALWKAQPYCFLQMNLRGAGKKFA